MDNCWESSFILSFFVVFAPHPPKVIYVFSLVAITWFQHHYDDQKGVYCETLFQCILSNLYYG